MTKGEDKYERDNNSNGQQYRLFVGKIAVDPALKNSQHIYRPVYIPDINKPISAPETPTRVDNPASPERLFANQVNDTP